MIISESLPDLKTLGALIDASPYFREVFCAHAVEIFETILQAPSLAAMDLTALLCAIVRHYAVRSALCEAPTSALETDVEAEYKAEVLGLGAFFDGIQTPLPGKTSTTAILYAVRAITNTQRDAVNILAHYPYEEPSRNEIGPHDISI